MANQKQIDAIAALLWDSLKRDPEHSDRRQTGIGTKTKMGLALSVESHLMDNADPPTDRETVLVDALKASMNLLKSLFEVGNRGYLDEYEAVTKHAQAAIRPFGRL